MQLFLDRWNEVKKKISQYRHRPPSYHESDIWWVSVGYNIGYEIYGKGKDFARPVLIIKKFNREFFVGIPLSTKIKDNQYYIPITIGTREVSALISQIRVFSTKRMLYQMCELEREAYERVVERVKTML
ncbi:MAG: type II toxin-antitoxin system PemK/MazF family toxin [Candidatus Dojkabacteria bacterium]